MNRIKEGLIFVIFLFFLLFSQTAMSQELQDEQQRIQALFTTALSQTPQSRALPYLWRISEIENTIPRTAYIQQLQKASAQLKHPVVHRFVEWELDRMSLLSGKPQSNRLHELGFVLDWWIAGPFDGTMGMDPKFTPEMQLDVTTPINPNVVDFGTSQLALAETPSANNEAPSFAAPAATDAAPSLYLQPERVKWLADASLHTSIQAYQPPKSEFISWMRYSSVGESGALKPSKRSEPIDYSVTYLVTSIKVDRDINALMEIPSSVPFKAWVNTEFVANFEEKGAYPPPIEGTAYPISLKRGDNTIAIKIITEDIDPQLYVILSDASGEPLKFEMSANPPKLDQPLKTQLAKTTPIPALYEQLLGDAQTPLAVKAYIRFKTLNETRSYLANQDAINAFKNGIDNPELTLMALSAMEEDWMLKREIHKAAEKFPDHIWIKVQDLKENMYGSSSQFSADLKPLEELIKFHPNAFTPLALLLAVYNKNNLDYLADAKVLEAEPIFKEVPAYYYLLVSSMDYRKSLDFLEHIVAQNATDAYYRTQLADLHFRHHDDAKGIQILKEGLALTPDNLILIQKLLQVYSERQPALANEGYIDALSKRPGNNELWMNYADFLQRYGNETDFLATLQHAVSLQANNPDASQQLRLEYHGNTNESFETPYIIHDIPAYENAQKATGYVSLLDHRVTKVQRNGLSSTFAQIVFQIVDQEGIDSLRNVPLSYSPSDETLNIMSVTVTKPDGTIRRMFETSERSVADESIRMYYDQRRVIISLSDLGVGDRIEFQFKRTQTQRSNTSTPFFSDIFQLQTTFPKMHTRYVVLAPEDFPINIQHSAGKLPATASLSSQQLEDGSYQYIFDQVNNEKVVRESNSPGWSELYQYIVISSFKTWQEVTDWYIKLSKGQWIVDDDIRNKVKELTAGVEDRREKMKRIHNFVVKYTRYVALEFGIHGYKPYATTQIYRRRFGDCKDKASLLKVMLEEAGIETHFVLIRTRPGGKIDTTLPNPYIFDHAIAYVPEFDLFLDGTAEMSGTSETPYQDQGTTALIVKNDGTYDLVTTPVQSADQNVNRQTFTIDLTKLEADEKKGDTLMPYSGKLEITGIMASEFRDKYQENTQQFQNFEYELSSNFPGTKLGDVQFKDISNLEVPVNIEFKASMPQKDLVTYQNKKISILPLGFGVNLSGGYAASANRNYPLSLPVPLMLEYSTTLLLKPETQVTLPENLNIKTPFGSAIIQYSANDGKLITDFRFQLDTIRVEPEQYPAFQQFIKSIDQVLNTKILISI